MKICFSIGVHDAVEDALISKCIIENNLPKKYSSEFVCGLTDHTKTNELRQIFKKVFLIETPKTKFYREHQNDRILHRCLRVFKSILKTGSYAQKKNFDFIVYLSAGSWILDPKKLEQIFNKIKQKVFAVRLANRSKYLLVDDHFLIVNLKQAKKYNIFNIKSSSRVFSPIGIKFNEIHGILYMWLNSVPFGKVHVYSNLHNAIDAFGNKPYTSNPLIFDTDFNFLHSNKAFKNIYILRALYIKKYVKKKNDIINEFINKIAINKKLYKYNKLQLPVLKNNSYKQNFYKPFLNYDYKIIR